MRAMREKAQTPLHIGTVQNYRHLWMLIFWVIYLVLFMIVEHAVQSDYYVVHCALDDRIPFCEWFIFPYCLWHPLLFAMTIYLAFWDEENFKRYMAFIAIGFIPVILFDWAFPNGQELRPRSSPPRSTRRRCESISCTSWPFPWASSSASPPCSSSSTPASTSSVPSPTAPSPGGSSTA